MQPTPAYSIPSPEAMVQDALGMKWLLLSITLATTIGPFPHAIVLVW